MNDSNINKLDLNLLRTLHVLIEECNVSNAAQRLSLTQSAVSHALSRLREQLNDPLFIRKSQGMVPTSRALELAGPLRQILTNIDRLVGPIKFDPAIMKTTVQIATADYGPAIVLPHIFKRIAKEAPHVKFQLHDWSEHTLDHLKTGYLDMALGGQASFGDCRTEELFTEKFVSVTRKNHPAVKIGLDLKTYLSYGHIQIDMYDSRMRAIDQKLEQLGKKRNITLTLPQFLPAPFIISRSDLIVTLPKRIAEQFKNVASLAILDLPVKLDNFPFVQVWHERRDNDPMHQWLRRLIKEQCRNI